MASAHLPDRVSEGNSPRAWVQRIKSSPRSRKPLARATTFTLCPPANSWHRTRDSLFRRKWRCRRVPLTDSDAACSVRKDVPTSLPELCYTKRSAATEPGAEHVQLRYNCAMACRRCGPVGVSTFHGKKMPITRCSRPKDCVTCDNTDTPATAKSGRRYTTSPPNKVSGEQHQLRLPTLIPTSSSGPVCVLVNRLTWRDRAD